MGSACIGSSQQKSSCFGHISSDSLNISGCNKADETENGLHKSSSKQSDMNKNKLYTTEWSNGITAAIAQIDEHIFTKFCQLHPQYNIIWSWYLLDKLSERSKQSFNAISVVRSALMKGCIPIIEKVRCKDEPRSTYHMASTAEQLAFWEENRTWKINFVFEYKRIQQSFNVVFSFSPTRVSARYMLPKDTAYSHRSGSTWWPSTIFHEPELLKSYFLTWRIGGERTPWMLTEKTLDLCEPPQRKQLELIAR